VNLLTTATNGFFQHMAKSSFCDLPTAQQYPDDMRIYFVYCMVEIAQTKQTKIEIPAWS
jgi:hypothetical protein